MTDNAEIMRLFQQSGNLLADEMEIFGTSIDDVNKDAFSEYFIKEFGQSYEEKGLTFEQALRAKRVLRNEQLTLAGIVFFGKDPQSIKPAYTIKVVSFFGNDISENQYRNKPMDLKGTIPKLYNEAMNYIKSSLNHIQSGQGFNSIGKLAFCEQLNYYNFKVDGDVLGLEEKLPVGNIKKSFFMQKVRKIRNYLRLRNISS